MARRAPLVGVGPGNFAVLFPRYAEPDAAADGVLTPVLAPRRVHDDLLERLTETGALGLLALLALYVALARAAVRRARDPGEARGEAAGYAGALAAFVGCGVTGFPLAMPCTVFLFAVAAGGLAAPTEPTELAGRPGAAQRIATLAVVGALTITASLWSAREIAASYLLGRAERALRDPAAATRALADLDRAAQLKPGDFDVALRTSFAASLANQPARAAAAAERALAIEPESPNAWEALARARLDGGDPAGAMKAAEQALERLHDYPAALETRAKASGALQPEGR
jgi:tetratricopeptide (TPR) repeat protein